jgi:hypothetical protein
MRYFLIFHTSNRVDFLSFYHQFPASSSREFALKPGFCAQTGHSLAALSSSWTHRTILMPDTSAISIIFDRTDDAAFSRIAKGSANRFFALRLTAPREGTWMRRCVADSGFFLFWRRAFGQPRHRPPDSPWRTVRTGAWPRRRSAATPALPNRCRLRGRFLASHRLVGHSQGTQSLQRRMCPKIRLYAIVLFGNIVVNTT